MVKLKFNLASTSSDTHKDKSITSHPDLINAFFAHQGGRRHRKRSYLYSL
jgi:hypothetical protein